jgi:hypothetical protein
MNQNKFPEYISDQTWNEGVELLMEKKSTGIIEAIKSIKSFIYNKKEQTMLLDQAYTTIYNNLIKDQKAQDEA